MKLSVLKNETPLSEYEVDDSVDVELAEIFIGRSEDCHIILDDQQVSRHHARIAWDGSNWFIKKISSFGQLIANGVSVDHKILGSGDSLVIHGYTLIISDIQKQVVDDQKEKERDQQTSEDEQQSEDVQENDLDDASETQIDEDAEQGDGDQEDDSFASNEDVGDEQSQGDEESFDAGIAEGEESAANFSDNNDDGDGENSDFNDPFDQEAGEEGGFGEPDFGGASEGDVGEGTAVISGFATFILSIEGDKAPYDHYTLEDRETFIGRDPQKCQIVLDDAEVSGQNSVLRKSMVNVVLEDLNSSNGTVLNGKRINKAELSNGDVFKIGSTTFSIEVKSDLIADEEDRLMPVDENQEITREEVVEEEVDFDEIDEGDLDFGENEEKQEESQSLLKNPKKRKKLIYAAVGLMLLMLLGDDGDDDKKSKKNTDKKKQERSANRVGDGEEDEQQQEGDAVAEEKEKKVYSPEQLQFLESTYQVAKSMMEQGNYNEAIIELDKVREIDPEYKNAANLYLGAKEGMKRLEELEKERRAEEERKKRQKKINEMVEKAKEAVKKKEVSVAKTWFSKILEMDPENIDVPQLKLEIEAYVKEKERIEMEKAQKEAERKRQVGLLQPGKTFFLKKEWYKATVKLEEFLQNKDIDEDLVKEGSDMLAEAKKNLSAQVAPLVGKARSFKEGQDLKGAYETYNEILEIEPTHEESLNQIINIKDTLEMRSRKVYREAIISESLSLFEDAKEKFQEVQQISPTDSEYYRKATDKLRRYLE